MVVDYSNSSRESRQRSCRWPTPSLPSLEEASVNLLSFTARCLGPQMNIAFLSLSDVDFNAASPLRIPLGGSDRRRAGWRRRWRGWGMVFGCCPRRLTRGRMWGWSASVGGEGKLLRSWSWMWRSSLGSAFGRGRFAGSLMPRAAVVIWCEDDHTQESTQRLKVEVREACTGVATVSHWQREHFHKSWGCRWRRWRSCGTRFRLCLRLFI